MHCFKSTESMETQNTLTLELGVQHLRVQVSRVRHLLSSFFLISRHLSVPISFIYSIMKTRGWFREEDTLRDNEQRIWGKYHHWVRGRKCSGQPASSSGCYLVSFPCTFWEQTSLSELSFRRSLQIRWLYWNIFISFVSTANLFPSRLTSIPSHHCMLLRWQGA